MNDIILLVYVTGVLSSIRFFSFVSLLMILCVFVYRGSIPYPEVNKYLIKSKFLLLVSPLLMSFYLLIPDSEAMDDISYMYISKLVAENDNINWYKVKQEIQDSGVAHGIGSTLLNMLENME
jgi:hypothetical protein